MFRKFKWFKHQVNILLFICVTFKATYRKHGVVRRIVYLQEYDYVDTDISEHALSLDLCLNNLVLYIYISLWIRKHDLGWQFTIFEDRKTEYTSFNISSLRLQGNRVQYVCFGNTIFALFDFWQILLNKSTWRVSHAWD